ncbi:hypothetical protein M413DRAFT_144833 [Hebeloma cylindrosporum]|uniref:BZIP domain-containing protein n=1 Tax=Hebeloma cylindrosporum TaxID=76867 RepID=A0A0C2XUB4_HEBCY|nr:hypothetical protein M413DRAFT_144833 [Hebeloma cylindrosporum h7]
MSSVGSYTAHAERPERSRNAKAQARHRAKRKAYIEQLEQTVTKLQIASGYTNEHVSALPPPLLKIRELEQENSRLQKENDELRRLLTDPNSRNLPYESSRRLGSSHQDSRTCDRDDYLLKRRKSGHQEGVYLSPSETPPHGPESSSRAPPALTIPNVPQQIPHSYINSNSNGHGSNQGGPLYPFQMPNTPSGSSATSSPPFSASIFPF